MEGRLYSVSENCAISIYEPSEKSCERTVSEPKLGVSGLILLEIMARLGLYASKERVRRACRLMGSAFANKDFDRAYNGVLAFKRFHHIRSNAEARDILYRRIVSDSVERTLRKLLPTISTAVERVLKGEECHDNTAVHPRKNSPVS